MKRRAWAAKSQRLSAREHVDPIAGIALRGPPGSLPGIEDGSLVMTMAGPTTICPDIAPACQIADDPAAPRIPPIAAIPELTSGGLFVSGYRQRWSKQPVTFEGSLDGVPDGRAALGP